MGSGDLTNISLIGNGAVVICKNSGSVLCEHCDHVIIEGITWDRCGYANSTNVVQGVKFSDGANVSFTNCTFQHSEVVALYLTNVHDNVLIDHCNFLSNKRKTNMSLNFDVGGLCVDCHSTCGYHINLTIHGSKFYQNGFLQHELSEFDGYGFKIGDPYIQSTESWNIIISQTNFSCNAMAAILFVNASHHISFTLSEVFIYNNAYGNETFSLLFTSGNGNLFVSILKSVFNNNIGSALRMLLFSHSNVTIIITNSSISENIVSDNLTPSILNIKSSKVSNFILHLENVFVTNNSIYKAIDHNPPILSGVLSIDLSSIAYVRITMSKLNVVSNAFFYETGGAIQVTTDSPSNITFSESVFLNNTSVRGTAFYIEELNADCSYIVTIIQCEFDHNTADENVIYVNVPSDYENFLSSVVHLVHSNFTNNIGNCIYLLQSILKIKGDVLFKNNNANKGAALYLNKETRVEFEDGADVYFIDNFAVQYGGAMYVNLRYSCDENQTIFKPFPDNVKVSFINNVGEYGSNSLYIGIFKYCDININYRENNSIMYVPYKFNYSKVINGTVIPIPSDYNYSQFSITHFPVITSPKKLVLYNCCITLTHNTYFINYNVLGKEVKFFGIILDYFDKPAEAVKFHLLCNECNDDFILANSFLIIDNSSPLDVILIGREVTSSTNITLRLLSHIYYYYHQIEVTLVIEFVPCPDHPGYVYSTTSKGCVCYYHDVVECYDDYNEITRGYWFGSVDGKATTSLCPSQYCKFVHRQKTREGYFKLPDRINYQCEHHRSGPACGECSPGYTLAYDSPNCISEYHCSAGMTVLVVMSTSLYWITLVCAVFSLMYFNFPLSSGYLFGIIYYYSMVDILLSNNPYISSGAFQFISILSGFAQLAPKFLGQLCLVEGLSGIDQLFIHYSHTAAISVVFIAFVIAARNSRRASEFISYCIIRVFCLLLLLAYTSLVSTSLLLLRPLTFTDIDEIYTYSSPNIKYFHGKHVAYGSVALICELVIGIGLPIFLMASPFLIQQCPGKLIDVKPLLDQFQGCYRDKYRWFAGYYLMCRQVLMLIVFIGNANYYNMVFCLEITCLIIAAIHACLQPYDSKFLNVFDGFILLVMVIVVMISSYDFFQFATTEIALVLVVIPLPVICIAGAIKRILHWRRYHYVAIKDDYYDDFDVSDREDLIR